MSMQADSEERAEIAMQTSIIDYKSDKQQVDVYELLNKRDGNTQTHIVKTNFLTNCKDVAVGTDFNRKLLVTQEWFYSQL